jgi:PEP-CTERM motif
MRHRSLLRALLFCLGIFAFVRPVRADTMDGVTFTLVNANLTGSPGDTLTWDYNVSNASGVQIFGLFVDGGNFLDGIPNSLAFDGFGPSSTIDNGSLLQGVLFSFFSDPLTPNSFNSGKFALSIQLNDTNSTIIKLHADYSATISPAANVPEPGTLLLLASGLLAGLLVSRRAVH